MKNIISYVDINAIFSVHCLRITYFHQKFTIYNLLVLLMFVYKGMQIILKVKILKMPMTRDYSTQSYVYFTKLKYTKKKEKKIIIAMIQKKQQKIFIFVFASLFCREHSMEYDIRNQCKQTLFVVVIITITII